MAKQLRLLAYRTLRNIKQKEMSRLMNLAPSTYSFKENGKADFKKEEMIKAAKILGTTVEDIFFSNDVAFKDTKKLKT